MNQRAIFLDKDGTLIVNVPYNVDPNRVVLMPGADKLLRLKSEGFRFVVISNQAGVAQGYFDSAALHAVSDRMNQLLSEVGIELDGFYFCPHHPDARLPQYRRVCDCRKPAPGLIRQAALELDIDLSRSWFFGDILDDIEAGNRAGCGTILVDVGSETEWQINDLRLPDYRVTSLAEAVDIIVGKPISLARHNSLAAITESESSAIGKGKTN